jgi:hypothetical protein
MCSAQCVSVGQCPPRSQEVLKDTAPDGDEQVANPGSIEAKRPRDFQSEKAKIWTALKSFARLRSLCCSVYQDVPVASQWWRLKVGITVSRRVQFAIGCGHGQSRYFSSPFSHAH